MMAKTKQTFFAHITNMMAKTKQTLFAHISPHALQSVLGPAGPRRMAGVEFSPTPQCWHLRTLEYCRIKQQEKRYSIGFTVSLIKTIGTFILYADKSTVILSCNIHSFWLRRWLRCAISLKATIRRIPQRRPWIIFQWSKLTILTVHPDKIQHSKGKS